MALACLLAQCDPSYTRGMTLAPTPAPRAEAAFAAISAVAQRNGLRADPEQTAFYRVEGRRSYPEPGWRCHSAAAMRLCATTASGEVQIQLLERRFSASDQARSLWQELHEALRAEFPSAAIGECEWRPRSDPNDPRERAPDRATSVCRSLRILGRMPVLR